jgi:putative Holliday junction resolvase
MGIDFGTKKVGIALTDERGTMAFPHSVIPNDEDLQKNIEALITKEGVEQVVIGHSIDKEGRPNKVQEAIEAFMLDLTLSCGVPIELEKERFTTQEALRIQGKTKLTDASAAALILDSYLMRNPRAK